MTENEQHPLDIKDRLRGFFIKEPLSADILDPTKVHDLDDWDEYLYRAERPRTNIFREMGVPDNPENRINLISSFARSVLENDFPGFISKDNYAHHFMPGNALRIAYTKLVVIPMNLFGNLDNLIGRKGNKDRYFFDPTTLGRHLHRSGHLCRIIGLQIERGAESNPKVALALDKVENKIGGNKTMLYFFGAFHDIGRYVEHSTKHEEYTDRIIRRVFENDFAERIINGIHQPVPHNRQLTREEIESYDNEIQRIVRLSDLFAKTIMVNKALQLRGTIQEVCAHSRKKQRHSYRKERKNPDSPWYRKTKNDLNIYLQNEEGVLNRAVEWLSSLGISFEDLIKDTNWRQEYKISSNWVPPTVNF